jgi:hypothetical protein
MRSVFLCGLLAAVLGATSDARAQQAPDTVLTFTNGLDRNYRLTRVRVVVDGETLYDAANPNAVTRLPPGRHVVELIADYHMHSPVFTYLDHVGIEVRSAHIVRPTAVGRRVDARVVRTGDATTPVDRRAAIAWMDR